MMWPQDLVFWYKVKTPVVTLNTTIKTEVAIIGGGMAGLSAAQTFAQRGFSVVLLEKTYCGAGASGKSSGFITPDSELDLSTLAGRYGDNQARALWDFVTRGVQQIRHNILTYNFDCDYTIQNSAAVANSARAFKEIEQEHAKRLQLGYPSMLYTKDTFGQLMGSQQYYGARAYEGTFGIKAFDYCQSLKKVLIESGVKIYEESPVLEVKNNIIKTPQGSIIADTIIVCADYAAADLNILSSTVCPMQTCLLLSEPLSDQTIHKIFHGNSLMVWDTDIIYSYFRLVEGNRLLLGGGNLFSMYLGKEQHNNHHLFKKLTNYFQHKFPEITINFRYQWPGLIGVSKDIMPLAGKVSDSLYCISATTGLPWASSLGTYAAEQLLDNRTDLHQHFNPFRKFPIGPVVQKVLSKPISFALSHFITEFI